MSSAASSDPTLVARLVQLLKRLQGRLMMKAIMWFGQLVEWLEPYPALQQYVLRLPVTLPRFVLRGAFFFVVYKIVKTALRWYLEVIQVYPSGHSTGSKAPAGQTLSSKSGGGTDAACDSKVYPNKASTSDLDGQAAPTSTAKSPEMSEEKAPKGLSNLSLPRPLQVEQAPTPAAGSATTTTKPKSVAQLPLFSDTSYTPSMPLGGLLSETPASTSQTVNQPSLLSEVSQPSSHAAPATPDMRGWVPQSPQPINANDQLYLQRISNAKHHYVFSVTETPGRSPTETPHVAEDKNDGHISAARAAGAGTAAGLPPLGAQHRPPSPSPTNSGRSALSVPASSAQRSTGGAGTSGTPKKPKFASVSAQLLNTVASRSPIRPMSQSSGDTASQTSQQSNQNATQNGNTLTVPSASYGSH